MIIEPLTIEHFKSLQLQKSQLGFMGTMNNPEYTADLIKHGDGWAAVIDGKCVAMAGTVEQWQNRAYAWALLGGDCGGNFIAVHKAVSRFIKASGYKRIEAAVLTDLPNTQAAVRWMDMLGFKFEGLMQSYSPDGDDAFLFARVQ